MKNRASLVLMELLVMVLAFALTASWCMQAFLRADEISRNTARQDQALALAQNGVEALKASHGDMAAAADLLGGTAGVDRMTLSAGGLELEMERIASDVPGLGRARVQVTREDTGEGLISLETGWQEVD